MPERDTPGYERRDLNPRAIRWAAIGLVLMLVTVFVGIRLFEAALGGRHPSTATPLIEVPPPRLQADPAADLAKLRASAEAKLDSYGWVDRSAGVIRIPIDRAITLSVERGLPARKDEPRRHGEHGAGAGVPSPDSSSLRVLRASVVKPTPAP